MLVESWFSFRKRRERQRYQIDKKRMEAIKRAKKIRQHEQAEFDKFVDALVEVVTQKVIAKLKSKQ